MEAENENQEQETMLTSRQSEEIIKVKKEKAAMVRDKTIQAAYTAEEDIDEFRKMLKIWSKEDSENTGSDED